MLVYTTEHLHIIKKNIFKGWESQKVLWHKSGAAKITLAQMYFCLVILYPSTFTLLLIGIYLRMGESKCSSRSLGLQKLCQLRFPSVKLVYTNECLHVMVKRNIFEEWDSKLQRQKSGAAKIRKVQVYFNQVCLSALVIQIKVIYLRNGSVGYSIIQQ